MGNAMLRSIPFGFDLREYYTVVPPFDRLVFGIGKEASIANLLVYVLLAVSVPARAAI